jgi:hypothetical protein
MMMNNYDYLAMARIAPVFAPIYLSMFVFIASICLINILVAILMDAYDVATDRPFSRSMVEQLAIIADRSGSHLRRKLEPLKKKIGMLVAPPEHEPASDYDLPPPTLISTNDMNTILKAKWDSLMADGEISRDEAENFSADLEELTKLASSVLPGGGPSGFDLTKKMCVMT